MKKLLFTILAPVLLQAGEEGILIFEDDFERNESQEITEEIGNEWGSNSKKRAKGNKQVDLKDGAMHIALHPSADHAVSVTHDAAFRNGLVEMKFMLKNKEDTLGLNFADLQYKKVHAGHLCVTRITPNYVGISDLKTGVMDLKIREFRLKKDLSPALLKALQTKSKKFPHKLGIGKWHSLSVRIFGNVMTVTINGNEVAKFSSPGIGHPTKRTLRLSVPNEAAVDEVKIYSLEPHPTKQDN